MSATLIQGTEEGLEQTRQQASISYQPEPAAASLRNQVKYAAARTGFDLDVIPSGKSTAQVTSLCFLDAAAMLEQRLEAGIEDFYHSLLKYYEARNAEH